MPMRVITLCSAQNLAQRLTYTNKTWKDFLLSCVSTSIGNETIVLTIKPKSSALPCRFSARRADRGRRVAFTTMRWPAFALARREYQSMRKFESHVEVETIYSSLGTAKAAASS
ncbi:hypothetical protein EVAR_96142_1 [Eumeta japonica]|uniref:Uncharacterized protein n=1 Tax=Eumeta variegata TaxID=151549 RepID=A0A4C1VIX5_EUMVA|nr:hypothetical protein EVAR_96142_1 [Eumeta japonica]